jgi:hypothetical protein
MLICNSTNRQRLTQSQRLRPFDAVFRRTLSGVLLVAGMLVAASIGAADADTDHAHVCSATATLAFSACQNSVADEFQLAKAICLNLDDEEERDKCEDEAEQAHDDGRALCRDQRHARRDVCRLLGEGRYDPEFDPELFTDPYENTNLYFPLAVGNQSEFVGADETVLIEVLDETKSIEGVTCAVVSDRVYVDEFVIEDTNDWFAQAKDGDVWYCGEETAEYETFEGDEPIVPELVSIDGSFKAGRGGDKAGIAFLGMPHNGRTYRQEFSLSNAEDLATILSTSYQYGVDPELDHLVPADLANLLCAGDCVVTYEFTPLDPEGAERKYYAPHIGQFLTVDLVSDTISQLVDCNYDPRCADLPQPPAPTH